MYKHYLTVALRNLWRNRLTTLLNVFCLGLGITCFLAAYVLVNDINRTDGHFQKSDRIKVIQERGTYRGSDVEFLTFWTAHPLADYLKLDFPELEAVAKALYPYDIRVEYQGNTAERKVRYVDPEFLKIFDFNFIAGDPGEALSRPASAIITRSAAEAMFGSVAAAGVTVRIKGTYDVEIRAVIEDIPAPSHMSQSLISRKGIDLFVSMDVYEHIERRENPEYAVYFDRDLWFANAYNTYALLPDNGSFTQTEFASRLEVFGARHVPAEQGVAEFMSQPLTEVTRMMLDQYLLDGRYGLSVNGVLYVLGSLVLLIAALNFTNLASVQILGRRKEIGIRKVIGARQGEIVRQYLFETFILCLAAMFLSIVCLEFFLAVLNGNTRFNVHLPWYLGLDFWSFLAVLSLAVCAIASAYPGLLLAGIRPSIALGKGKTGPASGSIRTVLVCSQYFAASLLLIAAIVMYLQYSHLREIALGNNDNPLLVLSPSLRDAGINIDTFEREMRSHPDVMAITGVGDNPWLSGSTGTKFSRTPEQSASMTSIQYRVVSHDYFQTFEIPLLGGRYFSRDIASDISAVENFDSYVVDGIPHNIIVDESVLAKLGFSSPGDAVGTTIFKYSSRRDSFLAQTIVGVVKDAPMRVRGGDASRGIIYYYQPHFSSQAVLRISSGNVPDTLGYIDVAWKKLAPGIPLSRRFIDEQFEEAYSLFDSIFKAVVGLVVLAFVIAGLGLFGMAGYITRKRIHEVGIRKTLGASAPQIMHMLLYDFSKPLLMANLVAWPFAYMAVRGYLSLFVERIELSLVPFALSLVITLAAAAIAVGRQAFFAGRVNPARILRYE